MKIHYLQHVPFKDVAYMGNWAKENGYHLARTKLCENDPYPSLSDFDVLIIMGGPMGVYDEQEYPWQKTEKAYIQEAIHNNKVVIGICLGAQLMATVLGAEVYPNSHKEIGWFPVYKTPQSHYTSIGKILPESFTAFHWHGDTFAIPDGAVHLFESRACKNQTFLYGAPGDCTTIPFGINRVECRIIDSALWQRTDFCSIYTNRGPDPQRVIVVAQVYLEKNNAYR
jgi:GMP synthase-like glutamine amidotransferase